MLPVCLPINSGTTVLLFMVIFFSLYHKILMLQVKFSGEGLVLSIGSFIRCWDVSVGVLARDMGTSALPIDLKEDIQAEKKIRLGNVVQLLYNFTSHFKDS